MTVQRPILIIDLLNLFIRSYAAFPQMNINGEQMGGVIGTLKTLRKLVYEQAPRAVYVIWESGGSSRRRALFSEYKLQRRPEKLNRFYEDDIPDTAENKKKQLITLLQFMKFTPTCQIYVPDCEGDDVIAYLCRQKFKNEEKIIASSDKDMYQLLDDKTKVYSFQKKRLYTADEVFEEFRVTANNFALAKALCGDPSDNIPGVKGLGFKTAAKHIPMLGLNQDIILQDVFDYCTSHLSESKVFNKIVESKDEIKRNWKLVYLDGGMLSAQQASKVDNLISTFTPSVDRISLIKALTKEGLNDFDVDYFFYAFSCLEGLQYNGEKR